MSDAGNGADKAIEAAVASAIVITLTFKQGRLELHGPIHDKLFMYGILELAKQIVSQQPSEPPRVIVPTIGVKMQ